MANNKLFVGNLSYSVTNDDLAKLFADAGTVESANVIVDRATDRSKGFGFVEMSSDEEAQAAIEQFNGKDIDGRSLNVSIARPKQPRNDRY